MINLILTVIGGVLLFGIIHFLPMNLKPLYKLMYVVLSLIFANAFLYIYPILGIWQSIIIVNLLIFLFTYLLAKKFPIESPATDELVDENAVEQTNIKENEENILVQSSSNQQETDTLQSHIDEDEDLLVTLENNEVDPIPEEVNETPAVLDVEQTKEEVIATVSNDEEDVVGETLNEEDELLFEMDVIEETPLQEEVKNDDLKLDKKEREGDEELEDDLNEDEELFLHREVVATSDEETDHLYNAKDNEEDRSEGRERLFAQLDGEDLDTIDEPLENVDEPPVDENIETITDIVVEATEVLQEDLEKELFEKIDENLLEKDEDVLVVEEAPQQAIENIEEEVVAVKKGRMNRQMRAIFIEQLQWTKKTVASNEYEEILSKYVKEELDDQDYYIFSTMLRDHFIQTEQFIKLQDLLTKLYARFGKNPIIKEEISFFEKKFF